MIKIIMMYVFYKLGITDWWVYGLISLSIIIDIIVFGIKMYNAGIRS